MGVGEEWEAAGFGDGDLLAAIVVAVPRETPAVCIHIEVEPDGGLSTDGLERAQVDEALFPMGKYVVAVRDAQLVWQERGGEKCGELCDLVSFQSANPYRTPFRDVDAGPEVQEKI